MVGIWPSLTPIFFTPSARIAVLWPSLCPCSVCCRAYLTASRVNESGWEVNKSYKNEVTSFQHRRCFGPYLSYTKSCNCHHSNRLQQLDYEFNSRIWIYVLGEMSTWQSALPMNHCIHCTFCQPIYCFIAMSVDRRNFLLHKTCIWLQGHNRNVRMSPHRHC